MDLVVTVLQCRSLLASLENLLFTDYGNLYPSCCGQNKKDVNVPWMNRTIADAIRKRNTLSHTSKRTGKLTDRIKYSIKRNQLSCGN